MLYWRTRTLLEMLFRRKGGKKGEGNEKKGNGDELEDYVDAEEMDDEEWVVKKEDTAEDLIWNMLCKGMTSEPPKLLIKKL